MRTRSAALTGLVAVLLLIPAASAWAADPTGDFEVSPNVPLVNESVKFSPKALADPEILPVLSGIKSVKFDFGDGSEVTDSEAPFDDKTHAYASAGTRTVVMTITDIANETATVEHNVRVNSRPTARFSFAPDTPNVGSRVTLDAGTSTDNLSIPNAGFDWDLDGDGQYTDAEGRTTSVTFRTPGDKTVRLRVTDSDGVTSSTFASIHVNLPPAAAFVYSPSNPLTGDAVDFTSVSRDPDGPIVAQVWDLDGDGQYDDASGATASITFKLAGLHTVRLRVTDQQGRTDVRVLNITVNPAEVPVPKRISPWPVIRIVGNANHQRVRIDLLTVLTAPGTTVTVNCRGKACPRRKASSTRAKKKLVRVRWLERQLRPGTRIVIAVTQPGRIGQYTTLKLRKTKKPVRNELCLYPGQAKATRCGKIKK